MWWYQAKPKPWRVFKQKLLKPVMDYVDKVRKFPSLIKWWGLKSWKMDWSVTRVMFLGHKGKF